jgi:hypothetical protein
MRGDPGDDQDEAGQNGDGQQHKPGEINWSPPQNDRVRQVTKIAEPEKRVNIEL